MIWLWIAVYFSGYIAAYFAIKKYERELVDEWTVGDREDALKHSIWSWLVLLAMGIAGIYNYLEDGRAKRAKERAKRRENRRNKLAKW